MGLLEVVVQLAAVVTLLNLLVLLVVVDERRLRAAPRTVRTNLVQVAPILVVFLAILAVNKFVRDAGVALSWLIGVNITGYIHAFEGPLVGQVQALANPPLTAYLGFVYVFGYTFLLTFPALAYVLHDDHRPFGVLLVAYVLNYGIGMLSYVLFVAYGPRNFMPELVDPLLYTAWPEAQLLTSRLNTNTNVFPSLHTSLSVSVGIHAYLFRTVYPRWVPLAVGLAASITVSTMYLGIHWATDVLAGVVVAVASVAIAVRVGADRDPGRRTIGETVVSRGFETLRRWRGDS